MNRLLKQPSNHHRIDVYTLCQKLAGDLMILFKCANARKNMDRNRKPTGNLHLDTSH